jgi:hypothetical protein
MAKPESDIVERLRRRVADLEQSRDVVRGIYERQIASLRAKVDDLTRERDKLQAALAFWMPGVSEGIEIELNGRAGDDAYLLAGFDGEVPAVSWGDKTLARAEAAEERLARIRAAAKAVLAQWDTPNWKLQEPTAKFMEELRSALAGRAAIVKEEGTQPCGNNVDNDP